MSWTKFFYNLLLQRYKFDIFMSPIFDKIPLKSALSQPLKILTITSLFNLQNFVAGKGGIYEYHLQIHMSKLTV